MTRLHLFTVTLFLSACGGATPPATTTLPPSEDPHATCAGGPPSFEHEVRPLLERYCFECHARDGNASEEHDFEDFETLFAQRKRVARALAAHAMPPSSASQPSESERATFARWARCARRE